MPTHFDGSAREKRSLNLFIKLIRASASVESRTSGPVAAAGLTPSQFGALETLYFLGPLPAGRLAEKHLKSPNNFTVVISNLEQRGLVVREKAPHDRRIVMVELTTEGRVEVERIMPRYVSAIVDDLAVLSAREQQQLGELLRKLGRPDGAAREKATPASARSPTAPAPAVRPTVAAKQTSRRPDWPSS